MQCYGWLSVALIILINFVISSTSTLLRRCFVCSYGNPEGRTIYDQPYGGYGYGYPQDRDVQPGDISKEGGWASWSEFHNEYSYNRDRQRTYDTQEARWFGGLTKGSDHEELINSHQCREPPDLTEWDDGFIKRGCSGPCVKATTTINHETVVKRYCHLHTTVDEIDWRYRDEEGCVVENVSGFLTKICLCGRDLCNTGVSLKPWISVLFTVFLCTTVYFL